MTIVANKECPKLTIQPIDVGATKCNMRCTKDFRPVCATPKGNTDPAFFQEFDNACLLLLNNCEKDECE